MGILTLNKYNELIKNKFGHWYTTLSYDGEKHSTKILCNTCGDIHVKPKAGNLISSKYNGFICKKCDMPRRHKINFYRRCTEILTGDFEFVEEYQGKGTPILIQHNACGSQYLVNPERFLDNYKARKYIHCNICAGYQRKTTEQFGKELLDKTDKQLELIGEYTNAKTLVLIRCNVCKSAPYYVLPDNILRRGNCVVCGGNRGKYKQLTMDKLWAKFLKNNHEAMDFTIAHTFSNKELITSKDNIQINHLRCGTTKTIAPYLLPEYECAECKEKDRKLLAYSTFLNEVKENVGDEYSVIGGTYINNLSKMIIKHNKCEHEFSMSKNHFISAGNRCPECFRFASKGEELCKSILTDHGFSFKHNVADSECKHTKALVFDIILDRIDNKPEMRIEYDGAQHFGESFSKNTDIALADYRNIVKRDNVKNQYCKEKGILLLRIPFTYKDYEVVEDIIMNFIEKSVVDQGILDFYKCITDSNYA